MDVFPVCGFDRDHGRRLHVFARQQRLASVAGHPAQHVDLDEILADGTVYDGAVPNRTAWDRSGLLLQWRTRGRLVFSDHGGLRLTIHGTWAGDCAVRLPGQRADDPD